MSDSEGMIEVGRHVRLRHNPNENGVVLKLLSGGYAKVQLGATATNRPIDQLELVPEDTDDLFDRFGQGRLGTAEELRHALSSARLSGRLSDTIYSMEVTNTDFYAHQFKPVLKLLASPSGGLLIADEVGLGKTIEAGLIWTELRARYDARRLLVICPKTLCRKWRDELAGKFDVRAEILDAGGLDELLRSPDLRRRGFAAICGVQGARPPRGWDDPDVGARTGAARLARRLQELAEELPVFDLLVIDEAHHLRNTETQTHQLGQLLQPLAEHKVFLSATPIHLKNRDLFALLRLLDPENFADEQQFQRLIAANRPLVAARTQLFDHVCRVAEVTATLHVAANEPLLAGNRQLAGIRQEMARLMDPLAPGVRSELAYRLEQVSLLSNVITRTRRRDVQELRVVRQPVPERIPLTAVEREVYDVITDIVSDHANRVGISDRFLLATPQRLLASCLQAAVAHWRGGLQGSEDEGDDEDERSQVQLGSVVQRIARACRNLPDDATLEANDGKFDRFRTVVLRFLVDHPNEKLIVFSSFRPTLRYLERRLAKVGLAAVVLHGEVKGRDDLIARFAAPNGPRLLLSSEIGGEGIDLQFCRAMVNYDMPWNPMRVEQRIGRIDRLGQQAEQIVIWNLVHADTIDERIYDRLYARLELCREALGDYEDMLGDYVRELTAELLRGTLSEAALNARFAQTEQALAERARTTSELEKEAAALIAHGDFILQTIRAAREMHRWITPEDIVAFLADAFGRLYSGCEIGLREDGRCELRLSPGAQDDYRQWVRDHDILDSGRLARDSPPVTLALGAPVVRPGGRREETLNQTHPFLRFVATRLRPEGTTRTKPAVATRIKAAALTRHISPGVYVLLVQDWQLRGSIEEDKLVHGGIAIGDGDGAALDDDDAETLCRDLALSGMQWPEVGGSNWPPRALEAANRVAGQLRERFERYAGSRKLAQEDRAAMQLRAVEAHRQAQTEMLRNQLEAHRAHARMSLVAATEGRLTKLNQRCEERLARIGEQSRMTFAFDDVAIVLAQIVI